MGTGGECVIQVGDNVKYTGWLPDRLPVPVGRVDRISGGSALVVFDGLPRWVDLRNLEKVGE